MGKKILIIVFAVLFIMQVSCSSDTTQKEKNDKPARSINNELVADRGSLTNTGEPIEKDQENNKIKQLEYKPGKFSTNSSEYKKVIDVKVNKNYKQLADNFSIDQLDSSEKMENLVVDWQVKTGFGSNWILKLDNEKILSVYTETLRGGTMTSLIMIDSNSGEEIWSSECHAKYCCQDYNVFNYVYSNNKIVFSTYESDPWTIWCLDANNGEFLWQMEEGFFCSNLYLIEKENCFLYVYNEAGTIIKRDFNGKLVQNTNIKDILKNKFGKNYEIVIKSDPFKSSRIKQYDISKKDFIFNDHFYLIIQANNKITKLDTTYFCVIDSGILSLNSMFPISQFDDSTETYSNDQYIAIKNFSKLKLYSLSNGNEVDINSLSKHFSYSSGVNLIGDSIVISDYNYIEQYNINSKMLEFNLPLSDLLYVNNDRMVYIDRSKTKITSNITAEETVCCINTKTHALLWETKFSGRLYEESLANKDLFLDCWYICKSSQIGNLVGININTGNLWFSNKTFTKYNENECFKKEENYYFGKYFLTTHGIYFQTGFGYTNLVIKLVPEDTPNKLLISTTNICLSSGKASLTIRNTTNEEIDISIIQEEEDHFSSNTFEIKTNFRNSKMQPLSEIQLEIVLTQKPEFPSYQILIIKSGAIEKMIYISTGAIEWGDV